MRASALQTDEMSVSLGIKRGQCLSSQKTVSAAVSKMARKENLPPFQLRGPHSGSYVGLG